ncbi:MAG: hypothetical protein IT312_08630 [Anaerolineales bacterium]|nr:hypothetical protein [Anaerolineales bacterium]
MTGALAIQWMKTDVPQTIKADGQNERRGLSWRQLPLLPPERNRAMSRGRSSRSYFLWVRLRSLVSFRAGFATERDFVNWLTNALAAAEFGALSLAWVKENAKRDLRIGDDQLFAWIARHCIGDAEFRSDGESIRFRDVYDE